MSRLPDHTVVIVGGGYTGTCAAIALVRRATQPVQVCLVDPSPQPGRGLAYAATDPDHRLNAPTFVHTVIPDQAWHFLQWCHAQGLIEQDPDCLWADGGHYMRRADFGRYLQHTLDAHRHWPATGSRISTVCDVATALSAPGEPLAVHTQGGAVLRADMVILATGNAQPGLPAMCEPALAQHPAVVVNPLNRDWASSLQPDARVLVLGTGLTALDMLSTLVRRGHQGPVLAVSRRGLRPRPQAPMLPALVQAQALPASALAGLPGTVLLDKLAQPAPAFLQTPQVAGDVRQWLRALRRQVAQVQAQGGVWTQPFDELRDALWRLWPGMPAAQKQRFQARLRTWYDAHRFRSTPQNQAMVDAAVAQGRITFQAGRVRAVKAGHASGAALSVTWVPQGQAPQHDQPFDALINCTGLDPAAGAAANPLLASLLHQGRIRRDASGIGLEVNPQCCVVDAQGRADARVRLFGPPTAGTWGDPLGALYIGTHIHRLMPDVLASLGAGP